MRTTGQLLHDYTVVLSQWITTTPVTQVTTTVKIDRQGIAVTANFAALWTTGYSADSMVGDRRHLLSTEILVKLLVYPSK